MTEFEALQKRVSVRSYESRAVEPEKLSELAALIDEINSASGS